MNPICVSYPNNLVALESGSRLCSLSAQLFVRSLPVHKVSAVLCSTVALAYKWSTCGLAPISPRSEDDSRAILETYGSLRDRIDSEVQLVFDPHYKGSKSKCLQLRVRDSVEKDLARIQAEILGAGKLSDPFETTPVREQRKNAAAFNSSF